MTEQETRAVLTLSLMAAFADGRKDDSERAEIKRIADSLSPEGGLNLSALYQDVLLERRSLEDAAAQLQSPAARQLAYEMAVCTCDADGAASVEEKAFLARLGTALGLSSAESAAALSSAEEVAVVPVAPEVIPAAASGTAAAAASAAKPVGGSLVDDPATDRMILNYAILNGALELLPESVATMAIIPLQMKMVYRVGKQYGYELDRGHIKDLLATLGVGLTGQYLEQIGRKLLGGLLKKAGGGMLGSVGKAGISVGMSFATTYALGQVARQYYSGGRSLDAARLKQAFDSMLGQGQGMYQRYAGEIQQKASTLDARQIANLVRGG
ncbi:MAG: DUF533 domain-containing protein [Burkholderiales bacterium]|nr:DUF533 domain-containing protein [Burkholderiales bacterium]